MKKLILLFIILGFIGCNNRDDASEQYLKIKNMYKVVIPAPYRTYAYIVVDKKGDIRYLDYNIKFEKGVIADILLIKKEELK